MAAASYSKATKHALRKDEQPGTSQAAPTKRSKKSSSSSKGSKASTAEPAHAQARVPSVAVSGQDSLEGEELRDQDMSEDEHLSLDLLSFVGLFKPQLFRSLLHKAKTTTHLGLSRQAPKPGEDTTTSVPLFEEPVFEVEEIPGPKLFKDILQRQWASPALGPNPNGLDRRLYNLAPDISTLLHVLSVDPPVVALSAPSNLTGPPEESLRPEDKRLEHSLVKAHQATAWSVMPWPRPSLTRPPSSD